MSGQSWPKLDGFRPGLGPNLDRIRWTLRPARREFVEASSRDNHGPPPRRTSPNVAHSRRIPCKAQQAAAATARTRERLRRREPRGLPDVDHSGKIGQSRPDADRAWCDLVELGIRHVNTTQNLLWGAISGQPQSLFGAIVQRTARGIEIVERVGGTSSPPLRRCHPAREAFLNHGFRRCPKLTMPAPYTAAMLLP